MNKWLHKKNLPGGDRLEKIIDKNSRQNVPLPIKIQGRAENNLNVVELFQYKKRYPALRISFNSKTHAEALDGKKILVTIEVIN